jgi:hypothetical protein
VRRLTADSELFVEEAVRDAVAELLGRDVTIVVPDNWRNIWDEAEFPDYGVATVLEDNKPIGFVIWFTRFEIYEGFRRYIEAEVGRVIFVEQPVENPEKLVKVS